MKTLKANIPSIKTFMVNENGEIFNQHGKQLNGKKNPSFPYLKGLDFLNLDKKRQTISFAKIVWNTFNPDNMTQESDIIQVIDQNAEYVFAISNLRKIKRKDRVEALNKVRFEKIKQRQSNV